MTAVKTTTKTSVVVNTQTRSVAYVANELIRVMQETVMARGLALDYVHCHHELLSSGFRTWLAGRWLRGVIIEVYDTSTGKLVEKFVFEISYETQPNGPERFKTDIDKAKAELARLQKLRQGCRYVVFADIGDKAPRLPGWSSSSFRDASHLTQQEFGGIIDTAAINAALTYFGERSDAECASRTPLKK